MMMILIMTILMIMMKIKVMITVIIRRVVSNLIIIDLICNYLIFYDEFQEIIGLSSAHTRVPTYPLKSPAQANQGQMTEMPNTCSSNILYKEMYVKRVYYFAERFIVYL